MSEIFGRLTSADAGGGSDGLVLSAFKPVGKNGTTGKADIGLLAPAPLRGLPTGDLAGGEAAGCAAGVAALGVTGAGLMSMASLLELEELSALPGAASFVVASAAGVEPKWLAGAGSSSASSDGSYSSSSSLLLSRGKLRRDDLNLRGHCFDPPPSSGSPRKTPCCFEDVQLKLVLSLCSKY